MLRTVVAIERDGMDVRVLSLLFEVPHKGFDLRAAVIKAATEYCQTEEGRNLYRYNCSCFNWADFASAIPAELCQKHGFRRVDWDMCEPDIIADWDEHLVDDSQLSDLEDDE